VCRQTNARGDKMKTMRATMLSQAVPILLNSSVADHSERISG